MGARRAAVNHWLLRDLHVLQGRNTEGEPKPAWLGVDKAACMRNVLTKAGLCLIHADIGNCGEQMVFAMQPGTSSRCRL